MVNRARIISFLRNALRGTADMNPGLVMKVGLSSLIRRFREGRLSGLIVVF
jgi:hypothetical protein